MNMRERDRSDRRPVDRFFLVAIVAYALLALAFIGYFAWRLFAAS
jgi:nitrate reductase NapE component